MTFNPLREDAGVDNVLIWTAYAVCSHYSSFISFFQRPKHILVFQHIPLYLKNPDEEEDYFNLQKGVRQKLLDRFRKAGREAAEPESGSFCKEISHYLLQSWEAAAALF